MSNCLGEAKGIGILLFRGGGRCHAYEVDESTFADEKNMLSVAGPPTEVHLPPRLAGLLLDPLRGSRFRHQGIVGPICRSDL